MNYNKTLCLLFILIALTACKSTQGLSDDVHFPERKCISTQPFGIMYSIDFKRGKINAYGYDCPSDSYGICFANISESIDDEPTCFLKNETGILSMAIPLYNGEQIINPQFEMFEGLDVLSITDSLVLWNEETLEALDFTTPVAVVPDDYRITRSHDTLYLDLQTSPVNLEKKVCAFFYYDNHILQSARFQDYYEGFLGASDIMTGTVSEVSEEYLILTFSYELNVSDALNEVRYISDNRIFSLREDITCNDYSICHILGFSDFFRLLHGEYEIEMIESGFRVKIPYILR